MAKKPSRLLEIATRMLRERAIVVMTLAFAGTVGWPLIRSLVISSYLGKVVYEVIATPMTYAVVNFLKRREGIDTFDVSTDFNPFHHG